MPPAIFIEVPKYKMDILSDISSVTSYGSMPPLIDMHGRIVNQNEDDRSTVTLDEPAEEAPLNTHLYFDDDGNEIDYERWVENNEAPVEDTWIRTPRINQKFILKHPRVILAFLRFVDFYNELADPDEIMMLPAIPQRIISIIREHEAVKFVVPEFQSDAQELIQRLERHANLSELHWTTG